MYLTDNFEMCINGDGIFSHSLLLIPLPPNIGGKWIKYTPLGVIVAFNCVEAAICPFFLSVPKQPVRCGDRAEMHKSSYPGSPKLQGLAVSKGYSPHPVFWRIGLKCKRAIWCPIPVVYPSQFKDTGLCSSLVGYSLPKIFANFTLKYVPTDCLCCSKPIK